MKDKNYNCFYKISFCYYYEKDIIFVKIKNYIIIEKTLDKAKSLRYITNRISNIIRKEA